ncbi:response regulator [Pseudodesulfovibrio cashew]|uniref:Response regulator n=1 Tax=Pseudodesulfovibrio cashew TaxID=2678688 RepID=A0A6I6JSS7_9BACT|nr:response regulator [Pseudodesulfovibrio cashew]QGY40644.1 response regulator [Pseudodesulfovibrio cashew]
MPEPTASRTLTDAPLDILVAEDSESNRMLIELYFQFTACRLDFATNGIKAVEKFHDKKYDIILMDIQMPGMDGYEATKTIRELERKEGKPPVPIVALTANAFDEDRTRCEMAGCTDFLTKPIAKKVLFECVARYASATPVDK